MSLKQEGKITYFVVPALIAQPIVSILAMIIYPPNFSKEFPVYDPNSIMLMEIAGALMIAGLTVIGIKLADESFTSCRIYYACNLRWHFDGLPV